MTTHLVAQHNKNIYIAVILEVLKSRYWQGLFLSGSFSGQLILPAYRSCPYSLVFVPPHHQSQTLTSASVVTSPLTLRLCLPLINTIMIILMLEFEYWV